MLVGKLLKRETEKSGNQHYSLIYVHFKLKMNSPNNSIISHNFIKEFFSSALFKVAFKIIALGLVQNRKINLRSYCKSTYYFLLPISRESIVLGSNFRNGDFDGFIRFEVS